MFRVPNAERIELDSSHGIKFYLFTFTLHLKIYSQHSAPPIVNTQNREASKILPANESWEFMVRFPFSYALGRVQGWEFPQLQTRLRNFINQHLIQTF